MKFLILWLTPLLLSPTAFAADDRGSYVCEMNFSGVFDLTAEIKLRAKNDRRRSRIDYKITSSRGKVVKRTVSDIPGYIRFEGGRAYSIPVGEESLAIRFLDSGEIDLAFAKFNTFITRNSSHCERK